MKATQMPQFLEYLHEHSATQALANELVELLALRGRLDVISSRAKVTDARRIAS